MNIDDTFLSGYTAKGDLEYTAALELLSVDYHPFSLTEPNVGGYLGNLYLSNFKLNNSVDNSVFLKKVNIEAKVS